jgi:16S rRNA processing protein RimM
MIRKETLFRIGHFAKPHGIKGELTFVPEGDAFDPLKYPFLICEMEGIPVPFYVERSRPKGHATTLVKLERMDDETAAGTLAGKPVYYPLSAGQKQRMEEDDEAQITSSWSRFAGYVLEDELQGWEGTITAVDETTLNTLFRVNCRGRELVIPIADQLIRSIDLPGKRIIVSLPEGITDL